MFPNALLYDPVLIAVVSQLAAGLRSALVLFAFMAWLTAGATYPGIAGRTAEDARRLNALAWSLMCFAALVYSPIHTFMLRGYAIPPLLGRLADVAASGSACAGFITVIASRGRARGFTSDRIARGVAMNLAVALAIVLFVWITR